MFVYTAYMALIVCFILVIVLHAWFVRRLTGHRDRLRAVREEHGRLHAELTEASQAVADLGRGRESNTLSIAALEREIEELQTRVRTFLTEHPELHEEFGRPTSAPDAPPAADETESAAASA